MVIKNKKQKQQAVVRPFVRLQNELSALINNAEPGDRLPSEPELARQMGVSRATLREAMRPRAWADPPPAGFGHFCVWQPASMEMAMKCWKALNPAPARTASDKGALTIQHIPADADQSQLWAFRRGALDPRAGVIEAEKARCIPGDFFRRQS